MKPTRRLSTPVVSPGTNSSPNPHASDRSALAITPERSTHESIGIIRPANPEVDATSGDGACRVCAVQHKNAGRPFNRQIAAPDMQNEHDRLTTYADVAGSLLLIASIPSANRARTSEPPIRDER